MRVRRVDDLLSFEVGKAADAEAASVLLRSSGYWLDVVPGMDSVVVRYDVAQMGSDEAEARLRQALAGGIPAIESTGELVDIPIVYGGEYGPDLDDLCSRLGLTVEEFIALHIGGAYQIDLLGFTPGFAFVGGLDQRLQVPRRDKPRQRVEAGSVGIAGAYTGLYTLASPGGWTLIGRTPRQLFDPEAAEPFALRAGARVQFRSITAAEAGFES